MENGPYNGRSITTGKIHRAWSEGSTCCNHSGQARAARNRPISDECLAKAPESAFCKKCFPNGKPQHSNQD